MGLGSTGITTRFISRQTSEPANPVDGFLWINPSGGANGNNTERAIWNKSAGAWELTNSVGPDAPNYASVGALWRDTANGQQKVYDGAAWQNVGVTDHANLSNVQTDSHHSVPGLQNYSATDVTGTKSADTVYQNTTGGPMIVQIYADGRARIYGRATSNIVSSDVKAEADGGTNNSTMWIVPDTWYYKVTGGTAVENWVEYTLKLS